MNTKEFIDFLSQKINTAHSQAKNPFTDKNLFEKTFKKPIYTTIIWIDDKDTNDIFTF